MLRRRDCALTIDREYPAVLNLTHKAPVPVVTDCQSVTVEYGGCGMVCFFRPYDTYVRGIYLGIRALMSQTVLHG